MDHNTRICIKTAGATAKRLYERIKKISELQIVSFTDNDPYKWSTDIEGVPVESAFETYQKYQTGEINKLLIGTEMAVSTCRFIYRELIGMGFKSEDIWFIPIEYLKEDCGSFDFMTYDEYNYLQYLEFHLTNRCNLNCAGCSHFVPLIPKDDEIDYETLKKDLTKLRALVSHIDVIRIMGGEPLLSDKLSDCCKLVRTLYPYSEIVIATNGSLIQKMAKDLLCTLREQRIRIAVTCYPPMYAEYDETARFLKQNNISFLMEDIRWGMCSVLHRDETYKYKNNITEGTCYCYNLYQGCLYPCPTSAYIPYFNKHFNENFPEGEGIDLSNIHFFSELYNKIVRKMKICDYCDCYDYSTNPKRKLFQISGKDPKISDWIAEN